MEQTSPSHRAAWRSADLDGPESITVEIDLSDLADAATRLDAEKTGEVHATTLTAKDLTLGSAASDIQALNRELLDGRGIAIVRGFPVADVTQCALELMFWRVGLAIGTPVSQSVMGERLGHVINRLDVDPHARAYRRNEQLTPHSDPADVLAFLCVHPAAEGGENQFVSSMRIYERMRHEDPDLLARLERGYRYSRYGEQADGDAPITPYRVPVFSVRNGVRSCTYLRQYIEIANVEDPSCGLDDRDRLALDTFEAHALDPALALRFTLASGEAVFANNFTNLHARDAFTDAPSHPKRHLLRLWISAHTPRPVVDETRIYAGGVGIPPQPGRTPSYETSVTVL